MNDRRPKIALDNDDEVEMMAQMMAMFPNIEGGEILRVFRSCRGNASECVDILFKKTLHQEKKQAKIKKQTQKMLERELRKAKAQEIVESFPPLPIKEEVRPNPTENDAEVQCIQKSMESLQVSPDESIALVVSVLKAKVKSEIFSASSLMEPNRDLAQVTRDIKRNLALSLLEDDSDDEIPALAKASSINLPQSEERFSRSSCESHPVRPFPDFAPPFHPPMNPPMNHWMFHPPPFPQTNQPYPEAFPPFPMYPYPMYPTFSYPLPPFPQAPQAPFPGYHGAMPPPFPMHHDVNPFEEHRNNPIPNYNNMPPFYPSYPPFMPYHSHNSMPY